MCVVWQYRGWGEDRGRCWRGPPHESLHTPTAPFHLITHTFRMTLTKTPIDDPVRTHLYRHIYILGLMIQRCGVHVSGGSAECTDGCCHITEVDTVSDEVHVRVLVLWSSMIIHEVLTHQHTNTSHSLTHTLFTICTHRYLHLSTLSLPLGIDWPSSRQLSACVAVSPSRLRLHRWVRWRGHLHHHHRPHSTECGSVPLVPPSRRCQRPSHHRRP